MAQVALYHTGPTAPTSLNGASTGNINLTGKRRVWVQFDPVTNPSYRLYFRIAYAAGLTATALTTAECVMTELGQIELWLDPDLTPFLYWFVTDSTGTGQNGGANDRLLIMSERHNAGGA